MEKRVQIGDPGTLVLDGNEIDLFELTRVSELRYIDETEDDHPRVSLVLGLVDEAGNGLRLHFHGVQHLSLPDASPRLWVSELQLVDARDRGLDAIRYIATSEDGFVCHCADVTAAEVRR